MALKLWGCWTKYVHCYLLFKIVHRTFVNKWQDLTREISTWLSFSRKVLNFNSHALASQTTKSKSFEGRHEAPLKTNNNLSQTLDWMIHVLDKLFYAPMRNFVQFGWLMSASGSLLNEVSMHTSLFTKPFFHTLDVEELAFSQIWWPF